MSILKEINKPSDIKKLDIKSLELLAEEIRSEIIAVTENNGGHLASSLGAVEAIIALAYVFDLEKDKIIFDVGHQAYAYKILTDRKERFKTLKNFDGISGFPLVFESKYDSFSSGHAGDALAAALGYAYARDKKGENYFVITFVGDGAFCNGETLEALTYSKDKPNKFLTILNDNGMSISENASPLFNEKAYADNAENAVLKGTPLSDTLNFDNLGLEYLKISDGHDIQGLIEYFTAFKNNPKPSFLHLKTIKGKGYRPAELQSELYHGVNKNFAVGQNDFADSLGELLSKRIEVDDKIVTIVAGMSLGVGVDAVKKRFPDNFVDVGISEDFAVTFASSLALAGLKPVVCIYSTFLQRAYDQVVINVCLNKLPVVFLIDHAGLVADGYTHQGVFDIAYLSHIPDMTVLSPKDGDELETMLDYALTKLDGPVAIRYPTGKVEKTKTLKKFSENDLWEVLKQSDGKTCVLACGARAVSLALRAADGCDVEVVNCRSIKPLDEDFLNSRTARNFVTIEDGSKIGGFGSSVATFLSEHDFKGKLKIFAISDEFVPQGGLNEQLSLSGISAEEIKKYL